MVLIINKIHATNSTDLSLNQRFTILSSETKVLTKIENNISVSCENRVIRKQKIQAALKLKRRSLRIVNKRAAANQRNRREQNEGLTRANHFTRVGTNRANSSSNLASRLGPRNYHWNDGTSHWKNSQPISRSRSRSRKWNNSNDGICTNSTVPIKARLGECPDQNKRKRPRSKSFVRNGKIGNIRSRSRFVKDQHAQQWQQGARKRSRIQHWNNTNDGIVNKSTVPIKARLGERPDQDKRKCPISRNFARNAEIGNIHSQLCSYKDQRSQHWQKDPGDQLQIKQRLQRANSRGCNQQHHIDNNEIRATRKRGRSPSPNRRGGGSSYRNQLYKWKSSKPTVTKEDLDRDLDQYMNYVANENKVVS